MRRTFAIAAACMLAGCGSDSDKQVAPAANQASSEPYTKLIQSSADLPECSATNPGQLVYVLSDQVFKYCNESSIWVSIDLKGAQGAAGEQGVQGESGLSIAGIWRYHTDSYASATSLETDSGMSAYIGTVQVVKFSDGSAIINSSGIYMDAKTDSGGDTYTQVSDFGHSFILAASAAEQTYIAKLLTYSNARIRYKVTLGDSPSFKAALDTDGNFNNETDVSFGLTKL